MTKKILSVILFYYSAIAVLFITVTSGSFVLLFLPVLTYFIMEISRNLFYPKDQVLPGLVDRILVYYGFVVLALMIVTSFVSARSSMETLTALLFSPLLFYFITKVIPKRNKALVIPKLQSAVVLPKDLTPETARLKKEGVDIDRRAFLKLIGTAGLSLFMFAMFTKKAEAAFFGSVPGPGTVSIKDTAGNKIDPAEKHPTDGYNITDVDDSSPAYYGFMHKTGAWFIMKEDATTGAYRYTKGASGYSANWTGRAGLSYDYFDNVF